MDSDDEFMSGISDSQEEDFGAQEDSDDGSLGDGSSLPSILHDSSSLFTGD